MNNHTIEKIQYRLLIQEVKTYCSSSLGRELLEKLEPSTSLNAVKQKLLETSEARKLMDISGNIGISGTTNIRNIINYVEKDGILNVEQLMQIYDFFEGCQKISKYMKSKESYAPYLCNVCRGIRSNYKIVEEIESTIDKGRIRSEASSELKTIRRHISNTQDKIKEGLNKFLKNKKNEAYIQEFFISMRNGSQTIPIKMSSKNLVDGVVIESKNKTAFMEPNSVRKFTDQLNTLLSNETNEEYRILCSLTALVYDNLDSIKMNIDSLAYIDMIFAKGKYSKSIDAIEPSINEHGYINIVKGKHPLLKGNVVPLNIEIGKDFRSLIITGPNAGGKTVVLKTIGLLTLAVQSGFHIPCVTGTNISIFERIFVDIGDDQSIENALSTFSSHVQNLSKCINKANKSTLLLFDEIGSGTEPSEGAALAIAILEDVYKKGAITIATTHYNEIKNYSSMHPDFENAAMKFDKETLEPLYKLALGKSGESNALWISKKMGINFKVLKQAEKYMSDKNYDVSIVEQGRIRKNQKYEKQKSYYYFNVGDRVYINFLKKSGLIYKEKDKENNIQVYIDDEIKTLNISLIKLEARREDLYPEDYDLNSLFTSFKERKLEKDIKRGSKKTLKKIQKYGINELLK
ncbi:endonuclease MutS2 [Clostridium sp. DL1XJH146]